MDQHLCSPVVVQENLEAKTEKEDNAEGHVNPIKTKTDTFTDHDEEKHPRTSVKQEDSSEAKVDPRLKNTEWCTCGNCILLPTLTESICCREVVEIASRIPDGASCFCDDPNETKFYKDRQQLIRIYHICLSYLPNPPEVARELSEREIRMFAYRAFSSSVYGKFGPESCQPIPSCFVSFIRQTYPSPDRKCNAHHDNPASEMGAVDFLY